MLLWRYLRELGPVALGERRQPAVILVVGTVLDVGLVGGEEARLDQRRAGRAQLRGIAVGDLAGHQRHGHLIEESVRHLRGQRPLPDQVVEAPQILVDLAFERRRRQRGRGRADGLVGFLRVGLLVLVGARLGGYRLGAVKLAGHRAQFGDRLGAERGRVGTHVGDEADRALTEVDTFVQLLRDLHRAPRRQAEPVGAGLLQR